MKHVLIGLLLCLLVISGASCVRLRTSTKTTIDTVYVHKVDTISIKPDTIAIHKTDSIIETVFMEIEKDCPQAKPETIVRWKTKIQDVATMESLTGGELQGSTPDFKHNFRMIFKGNEPTIIWDRWEPEIHKNTETDTVKEQSYFRKVLDTWHFWIFPWLFFFLWLFLRFRR